MKKLFLLTAFFICCFEIGHSQPGLPDSSFGVNGIVTTNLGVHNEYDVQGKQVLVLPDGSMYILFSDSKFQIVKKFSNGTTDVSYGNNGYSAYVPVTISKAALQPDGKLVVAGFTYQNRGDYDFAVARFNTDGSLDKAFNGSGQQTTSFGSDYDIATTLAIQSDGKIVVAGSSLGETNIVAIARYNTNGSLDTAFNGSGLQTTNFGTDVIANSIVIQSDGKIAIGCASNHKFLLIRYNSDGSLKDFFDGNGILTKANGSYFVSNALAIQKDNKIVAAGYWENNNSNKDFTIVRFNVSGSIDSTFNSNGIQSTDFRTHDDYATSAVIQGDGKIVVAGYASNGLNYAFAIARYNTNGSADNTFDNDGKKMTFIGSSNVFALSVAIQNNGKLISLGYGQSATAKTVKAIKYNTNGSLDSTFASKGTLTDHSKQGTTVYTSTAIQSDGKIISAGYTSNGSHYEFLVSRFNLNGKLDSTFSGDGSATLNFGSSDNKITSAAIQKDGKIVVAGGVFNGTNYDFGIARFNPDGSLDRTFSEDGKVTTDFGLNEISEALAIQNDGKIVVVGYTSTSVVNSDVPYAYAIARYNTDGSMDKSFSDDGRQTTDSLTIKANSVAIQTNGKIVVAGNTTDYPSIVVARYNSDGSLDNTFNGNGLKTTPFSKFYSSSDPDYGIAVASSVAVKNDGKIIVGGYVGFDDRYYYATSIAIASYNPDGSYDNTFSGDGGVVVNFPSFVSTGGLVVLQDDGKIVVNANLFTEEEYGLKPAGFGFARINPDGNNDGTFGTNTFEIQPYPNDQISGIAISNKALYAVGNSNDIGSLGLAAKYLLTGNNAPTVAITSPVNNTVYTAPANITINASASDLDGTIYSVKFYNGTTYLKTDFTSPYSYTISNLPAGTYIITAKATDNSGAQTISAPVKVIVNKAPVVSITSPADNTVYSAPSNITVNAAATDTDGSIYSVKFYNGSTYLKTDFTSPYTYTISNLPAGTYSLTVKATDNLGAQTISDPVKVTVLNSGIVSNRPYSENQKTTLNDALSLRLSPNPASSIVNIYTGGLQVNKPATLSIISVSGNVLKTMRINSLPQTIPLDVSSLVSGVYAIKMLSGDKVLYTKFVKL